jgi:orotate phosphoribosyltransferase
MKNPCYERLHTLLRDIAYEEGEVTLASGRVSDFYMDCRKVSLHAEGLVLCGEALYQQYRALELEIDGVGGPTLGADPLIASFAAAAYHDGAPMHAFIVRKEPKGHGKGKMIEGKSNLPEGARVLLLEDVVTTGGSTVRTILACQEEGLDVRMVFSLVDRSEGGREAIEATGVPFHPLFTRDDFLRGDATS